MLFKARWPLVVTALACLAIQGCSKGPARVVNPTVDTGAGSRALETLDANGDGALGGDELDEAPGLKAAFKETDADGDGKLSADEINARIKSWQGFGRSSIPCQVLLDGAPLAGATVTFEPEPFLGEVLWKGSGVTRPDGWASVTSTEVHPPGMAPGCYRVKVSKLVGGKESIPARYNAKWSLGQEFAVDAANAKTGIVFRLESRK